MPFAVYNAWKPFSLADPARSAGRDAALKKVEAELQASRMAECTFAPALIATSPAAAARPKTPGGRPGSRSGSQAGTPAKAKAAEEAPAAE